jgi:pimeloyl-ACP methyl ester carboxylesterase
MMLAFFAVLVAFSSGVSAGVPFLKEGTRGGSLYRLHRERAEAARLAAGLPPVNTTVNWFDQPLYPGQPAPTFKQRYYVDWNGWNAAGGAAASRTKPKLAMIYIPGEGPCESTIDGYAQELGYEHGAVLVSLENRWYGESMPGAITDTALLKATLNVDIALSDLAVFIQHFNATQLPPGTQWYVVGGSYSGALSAWMRQSYPDLVIASWSSSGVVHPIFDFHEYDGHISNIFDADCYKAVQDALADFGFQYDADQTRGGVYDLLQTPSYFTKTDMQWALADASATAVQYGHRSEFCNAVLGADQTVGTPLSRYVTAVQNLFGTSFLNGCGYSTECLTNAKYSDQWAGAGYSWVWQCCSEMGWWQTGYPDSLRSLNVTTDYFMQQCRGMFGADTFPSLFSLNANRGGLTVNGTSNVVALQGSDDPWSTAGVRANISSNYYAYVAECANCGHCGDLDGSSPLNPPQKKQQHAFIKRTLAQWLPQM